MAEPAVGDVFGVLLRAALNEKNGTGLRPTAGGRAPRPVIEIVERDDGYIYGSLADRYLAEPDDWWGCERRAVDGLSGSTVDIGTGGGRVALALQQRGLPVTALDTSPGALDVCAAQGVQDLACESVDEHAKSGRRYDNFVLFGNNTGLLESRQRAPEFLAALAAMARPGARILANCTDPYQVRDPLHVAYHARNATAGRMGGQLRLRVRYLNVTTPWFDYLLCSVAELAALAALSGWRLSDVDDADSPIYVATLTLA